MNRPRPARTQQGLVILLTAAMTAALLLSLSGFWRQDFAAAPIVLMALGSALLGWVGWRRPLMLAALTGLTAALALALPFAGTFLARQWGWTGLLPGAAVVRELLRQLLMWGELVWAGRFETMPVLVAWFFLSLSGLGAAWWITREALNRGDTFWSLVAGTVLFGLQWALYYDQAQPYLATYVAAGILLWSLVHSAHRVLRWNQEGRRVRYLPYWGSAAAVGLVVVVAAGFLPTAAPPADLGMIGQELRNAFPVLQQLRGAPVVSRGLSQFGLRQVGFGGDASELGGPVRLNNGVALRVELSRPVRGPLYLRGTVHTQYTGRGWLPPSRSTEAVVSDRPLPSSYPTNVPRDYVQVTVTPQDLRTPALFAPLEPVSVTGAINPRYDEDGNLVGGIMGSGQSYQVLARMARFSGQQIRELSDPAALAPGAEAGSPIDLDPYLQLPDNPGLAPVRALAARVTADAEHPFDKALALERFLRSEYPYSLNVPPPPLNVPDSWDFTTYFLYEVQRGYCTYYSTAMAVMLRSLDIPTRWVQGFAVYPGDETQVTLANREAHAWVEAYFPGYGWVTFDPTPRGDMPALDRSYVPPPPSEQNGNSLSDPFLDPTLLQRELEGQDGAEGSDTTAGTGSLLGRGILPGLTWFRQMLAPAALAVALLLVALAAVALLRLRLGIQWRRSGLAVQQAYEQTVRILGQFGYGPLPHQTPREYCQALGEHLPELAAATTRLVDVYEQVRYGPAAVPPPAQAAQTAHTALQAVQQTLQQRFGKGHYLWRRTTRIRTGSDMLTGYDHQRS